MKKETVLSWSILIILLLTCGGLAIKTFQLNQELTSAKKEIVTKKSIFEKYVEINPLLKDLDDLIKFDFS